MIAVATTILYETIFLQLAGAFLIFGDDSTSQPAFVCNRGTRFECPCTQCGSNLRPLSTDNHTMKHEGNVVWLSVEFESCIRLDPRDELRLRSKLAEWVNEECAIVLNCAALNSLSLFLEQEHIVIGGLKCYSSPQKNSVLHLAAVYNTSEFLNSANMMEAVTLAEIVRAREHLLGAIMSANIRTIYVDQQWPDADEVSSDFRKRVNAPIWHFIVYAMSALLSSFIVSASLICCVVLGVLNWRINWKRIARGTWVEASSLQNDANIDCKRNNKRYYGYRPTVNDATTL